MFLLMNLKFNHHRVGFSLCALLLMGTLAWTNPYQPLQPPKQLKTQADVGRFLDTYYMQPRPAWVVSAFKIMSQGDLLDQAPARAPLIVFIAMTTCQSTEPIAGLVRLARQLPTQQAGIIIAGLWMADTKPTRTALQQLQTDAGNSQGKSAESIRQLLQTDPPDLSKIAIDSPAVLDMLWAWFLATGDTVPLQRIISVLSWSLDSSKVERYVIGHAAQQSLAINAVQHPAVLRYCERTIQGQPDKTQRVLQIVIDQAREKLDK